ncbi:MAG: NifU family protein [Fimbriimonas sp.]|nr:NifU family protein [Fimbriimonas sp.]
MSLIRTLLRRNPPEPAEMGPLYPQVKAAMIDVQAYARSHGGEIQLLGVSDEGDVRVKFSGACRGCPMSALTLKHGIELQLKELVPGVRKIVQV